jgi:hypothetical protein
MVPKLNSATALHEGIHLRRGKFVTVSSQQQDPLDFDGAVFRTCFHTLSINIIFQKNKS